MATAKELESAVSAIRKHLGSTQSAPQSVKRDWARSIIAAITIGGALATLGFFLFKSDAEATNEKTKADGVHTALEVRNDTQDMDRKRIEHKHDESAVAIDKKLEEILNNQWRQYKGRSIKPNGD